MKVAIMDLMSLVGLVVFFFFKQKTAYEIYQCDWSSDVCSSDLSVFAITGALSVMGSFSG